jgi:hypothetical protein
MLGRLCGLLGRLYIIFPVITVGAIAAGAGQSSIHMYMIARVIALYTLHLHRYSPCTHQSISEADTKPRSTPLIL